MYTCSYSQSEMGQLACVHVYIMIHDHDYQNWDRPVHLELCACTYGHGLPANIAWAIAISTSNKQGLKFSFPCSNRHLNAAPNSHI